MRLTDDAAELAAEGVSVVICAHNRPEGLARALASVLDDAPDVPGEIIVVDDGSAPPAQPPACVRLIRLNGSGVGAARQAGLEAARGAFIAWCDDDDVWLPGHLTALRDILLAQPSLAVVYADAEWRGRDGVGTTVAADDFNVERLQHRNYIHLTDALGRADAIRAVGGFDVELRTHEDWDLWLRLAERFAFARLPRPLAAHGRNADAASAQPTPSDRSQQNDVARIVAQARHRQRMRAMRITHLTAYARRVEPFDPATWSDERRELLMQAPLEGDLSFGLVARELVTALERLGVQISLGRLRFKPVPGYERFYTPPRRPDCLGFFYDYRATPAAMGCERLVRYTMWESTAVPHEQIVESNACCALVYVPCRQNVESYRNCGLRVPLKVLPHGVNAARFPLLERPRAGDEPYTFGALGAFSRRKGIDVLIRAFEDEFAPHEPVRLLLKAAYGNHGVVAHDPRVTLIAGQVEHAELLEVLRSFDAFVQPSRGEGFGLPGLEAMATGLPVIATNWSGLADYLDPADSFPLDYELVNAGGAGVHVSRFWGQWAEPSYEHLRARLRWLYEHRDEAAEMGRRASARVHAEWSWERPARQLIADCDALARGVTPAEAHV